MDDLSIGDSVDVTITRAVTNLDDHTVDDDNIKIETYADDDEDIEDEEDGDLSPKNDPVPEEDE